MLLDLHLDTTEKKDKPVHAPINRNTIKGYKSVPTQKEVGMELESQPPPHARGSDEVSGLLYTYFAFNI